MVIPAVYSFRLYEAQPLNARLRYSLNLKILYLCAIAYRSVIFYNCVRLVIYLGVNPRLAGTNMDKEDTWLNIVVNMLRYILGLKTDDEEGFF